VRAVCTCKKSQSIFDVVMALKGIDFQAATIVIAQILGRDDLIRHSLGAEGGFHRADAESLLKESYLTSFEIHPTKCNIAALTSASSVRNLHTFSFTPSKILGSSPP